MSRYTRAHAREDTRTRPEGLMHPQYLCIPRANENNSGAPKCSPDTVSFLEGVALPRIHRLSHDVKDPTENEPCLSHYESKHPLVSGHLCKESMKLYNGCPRASGISAARFSRGRNRVFLRGSDFIALVSHLKILQNQSHL